jgi:hypothetical protein
MSVATRSEHIPYFSALAAGLFLAVFNLERLAGNFVLAAFFLAVIFACGYGGSFLVRSFVRGSARRKAAQRLGINTITFACAFMLCLVWWFVFL